MPLSLILLNGPPGSGKDTAAEHILQLFPTAVHMKFARPLKDAFVATFGYSRDWIETNKDTRLLGFDMTVREWLIAYSEDFMKPQCGNDIFGVLAGREVLDQLSPGSKAHRIFVFSDCGFTHEVNGLLAALFDTHVEDIRVQIIQLMRTGCTWDSRAPIDFRLGAAWPELRRFDPRHIDNNGSLGIFSRRISETVEPFLRG